MRSSLIAKSAMKHECHYTDAQHAEAARLRYKSLDSIEREAEVEIASASLVMNPVGGVITHATVEAPRQNVSVVTMHADPIIAGRQSPIRQVNDGVVITVQRNPGIRIARHVQRIQLVSVL
jgi:hypothetical protein